MVLDQKPTAELDFGEETTATAAMVDMAQPKSSNERERKREEKEVVEKLTPTAASQTKINLNDAKNEKYEDKYGSLCKNKS